MATALYSSDRDTEQPERDKERQREGERVSVSHRCSSPVCVLQHWSHRTIKCTRASAMMQKCVSRRPSSLCQHCWRAARTGATAEPPQLQCHVSNSDELGNFLQELIMMCKKLSTLHAMLQKTENTLKPRSTKGFDGCKNNVQSSDSLKDICCTNQVLSCLFFTSCCV